MKGEYETIREAGAEVVAVSSDSPRSQSGRLCQAVGGCPFPLVELAPKDLEATRQYGIVSEDPDPDRGSHSGVAPEGGILLHQIPWFHSGVTPEQLMEIFRALGAI